MLASLAVFAVGSALCGCARNMNWLIAARSECCSSGFARQLLDVLRLAVQGAGGGGILALSSIIVSDMVTLQERGAYNGLLGMYVAELC